MAITKKCTGDRTGKGDRNLSGKRGQEPKTVLERFFHCGRFSRRVHPGHAREKATGKGDRNLSGEEDRNPNGSWRSFSPRPF
jgi:hypothetical protein